jgi:hydrogenase maturation factor
MTINDAVGILNGPDNAATEYLRRTTNEQVYKLYKPKIKASLDKKLIGNISTTQTWDQLTDKWNQVATSMVGQIAGFEPVEIDLDAYLTQKALDGLYIKIEAQEKLIREDPVARVNDLLKRVFGSLDK